MIKSRKHNRLAGFDYSIEALYYASTRIPRILMRGGSAIIMPFFLSYQNTPPLGARVFYFITSCVHGRMCLFGAINGATMRRNEYGAVAEQQWAWLQSQYPYIVSHAFVVMPNHIHAIIEIHRNINVGTGRDLSLQRQFENKIKIKIKIKSLSEIIGAYKTTVAKRIHLAGCPEFKWQRSFHDHIIRDDDSYNQIMNYIETNPKKWPEDQFFRQ